MNIQATFGDLFKQPATTWSGPASAQRARERVDAGWAGRAVGTSLRVVGTETYPVLGGEPDEPDVPGLRASLEV